MKRIYGMATLAALFALAASAQDAVMQKKMQDELSTALTRMKVIGMEGGVMSDVKGAPYRADQITETTQTLGDGTRIHNEHQVTIYRDSQGRVRRESPDQVSIWDPNSGVGYTLDTKSMTAGKMQVHVSVNSGTSGAVTLPVINAPFRVYFDYGPRTYITGAQAGTVNSNTAIDEDLRVVTKTMAEAAEATAGGTASPRKVELKAVAAGSLNKESLGMQIMEGVSAQGDRQTNTIEAGAIGNDRPIQVVSERWYSPDLQMEVMTRHSDPRTGEEITRLINISRAEPDASLFQVPAGYQITEGKGLPTMLKSRQ